MANYNKAFNFKNGVQVDNDNFVVNANGLVGIGTTVPSAFLDVRPTNGSVAVNVAGLVTTTELYAGIATVGFLTSRQGLSVSGVITATSFSGSAAGLSGIYAIAVDGWYVDTINTAISTTFTVGVGTTNPTGLLQVGTGITFNSDGGVIYSGVVTATSFSGSGAGITLISADNISTGTLSNDRLPTIDNSKLPSNINVSGIVTAGTFRGNFEGPLTGIAQSASSLTGTPNINVGIVTATTIVSGFSTIGISTITSALHVGTGGTAFSALNSGKIGVGTALPTSEIQIRKSSGSLLEVISDSGSSRISIGQSVGVGKSTAVLRFGDADNTFDIINNDVGNINMYLHNGPAGLGTGRFSWLYGQSNAELMSLTYDGKLGIGKTNPDNTLHVVGTSTVTGTAWFGGNVNISGSLNVGSLPLPSIINANIYSSSGISTVRDLEILNDLFVTADVGIGTTNPVVNIDARERTALFGNVGLGTTSQSDAVLLVVGQSRFDSVGIGTTNTGGEQLYLKGSFVQHNSTTTLYNSVLYIRDAGGIGVGTTAVRSAIDFGDAGKNSPGLLPGEGTGARSFLIPPRLTSSQRTGLTTSSGALIYNSDSNEFQGYSNNSWTNLGITTSNIVSDQIRVGTGVTVTSGIVTATNGFSSGIGTAVKITTVGNQLVFTVPGVGSTSFTLF